MFFLKKKRREGGKYRPNKMSRIAGDKVDLTSFSKFDTFYAPTPPPFLVGAGGI